MRESTQSAAIREPSFDDASFEHPNVHPTRGLVPLVTLLGTAGSADDLLLELASRLAFPGKPRTALVETAAWSNPSRPAGAKLSLDEHGRRVSVDGTDVDLTRLEFQLLLTLVNRRDRVLSRGDLLRDVWQRSTLNRTRTVDTHVKRLRDKLGHAGRYIQTVRGTGYRFSERVGPRDFRRKVSQKGPSLAVVDGVAQGRP